MNLLEASQNYIASFSSDKSAQTIRLYKFGINKFIDTVGNKDAANVTALDFDVYCQRITKEAKAAKWSAWTQHAYTRGPVGLLTYLADMNASQIMPQTLWKIRDKRIAAIQKPPYVLPAGIETFPRMLYETKPPDNLKPKDYQRFILEHAFVTALVSSGARIHEICKLTVGNFEGKRALILGKGNKYGFINFTAKAMEIIDRWMSEREKSSPYLFPALRMGKSQKLTHAPISTETGRQIVYRWLVKLLGDRGDITPHDFRHYAIILGIKSKGLRWAQLAARHADPATTAAYDESDADEVTNAYDEVMG